MTIKIIYSKVVISMSCRFPESTIRRYESFGYSLEEATLEEIAFIYELNIAMTLRHLKFLHKKKWIVLDRYLIKNKPLEMFSYLFADEEAYQNYLEWKESKAKLLEDRSVRRKRRVYRKRMEKKKLKDSLKKLDI